MKVILLSDQRTLGKRGETVEVKPGYGRNYLLPQGIALEATPSNVKLFEQQRKKIDAHHAKERDAAQEVANSLSGLQVTIPKRVGETGTLYGSVTAGDVADELAKLGYEIDKRQVQLEDHIKQTGSFEVPVRLFGGVDANVTVEVVSQ